jgi:hypothetical protein
VGTIARLPGPSAALRHVPAPRAVLQRSPTDRVLAASGRLLTAQQGYRPAQRARRQSQRPRSVPDSIIVLRHADVTLPSGAGDRRPRGTKTSPGAAGTRPTAECGDRQSDGSSSATGSHWCHWAFGVDGSPDRPTRESSRASAVGPTDQGRDAQQSSPWVTNARPPPRRTTMTVRNPLAVSTAQEHHDRVLPDCTTAHAAKSQGSGA